MQIYFQYTECDGCTVQSATSIHVLVLERGVEKVNLKTSLMHPKFSNIALSLHFLNRVCATGFAGIHPLIFKGCQL